jgi:hypothetical protein
MTPQFLKVEGLGPRSLLASRAARVLAGVPDIFSFFGEICPFGARWAIRASTTRPGGPAGAARAFIEVYRGAPPKCASCGAPQLDPATPLHPVSLNVDSRDGSLARRGAEESRGRAVDHRRRRALVELPETPL